MRIAFIILIGVHGIIHVFGFLKAFNITESNAISQSISKSIGLIWLLTSILFVFALVQFVLHSNYWWLSGALSAMFSQLLIFQYWSDTKFGTIANLIILMAAIMAYSHFSFTNKILEERERLFKNSQTIGGKRISKESISELPLTVQKWLINSGLIGQQRISNVYLVQELQLKMNPKQTNWNNGKAEQYFTTQPPAFNWSINTEMNSVLTAVGRDKFVDGKGEMVIKLQSLIKVANAEDDQKINEASIQRFLAEIVWFPSASLSPYIRWETVDDYSAKATIEYKGTKGWGVFHFDENGNFKKYVAMRYKDANDVEPLEWTIIATKNEVRNGIKIPTECQASWTLEDGIWTWLKIKIVDIQYNLKEIPMTNNAYSLSFRSNTK